MGDTPFSSTLTPEQRAEKEKYLNDNRSYLTPGKRAQTQMEMLVDGLQYQDPSSDPRYADVLSKLQGYAKGTLTDEDRAREYEALGEAQKFAKGQEGAIAQEAAARGGGGAGTSAVSQQVAAQGAASRLGGADVATAGMAAQRALAAQEEFARLMQTNSQMQNQFALQKAGMSLDTMKYIEMLRQAEAERQQQMIGNTVKDFASFAMGAPGLTGLPGSAAKMPSTTNQPGYFSSGNIGIPMPGASTGPAIPTASSFDASPGATTADAAAKAYAASLPFADLAAPGSAPSTTSGGGKQPFDISGNDFQMPRKAIIPGSY